MTPIHTMRLASCVLVVAALLLAGCGGGSGHPAAVVTVPGTAQVQSGASKTADAAGDSSTAKSATGDSKTSHAGAPKVAGSVSDGGASSSSSDPSTAGVGAGHGSSSHGTAGDGGRSDKSRGEAKRGSGSRPSGGDPAAAPSSGQPSADAVNNAPNAENGVPLEVKTAAMEPVYKPFSTVYYDPTATQPQLGQVIVYYLPAGATEGTCATPEVGGRACAVATPGLSHTLSLARVVGLPGEEVAVRNGLVVRNGQPVSEPSIQPCGVKELANEPGCEYPKAITVPAESYYVLADNRLLFQDDSRGFGAVTQAAIVGTVLGS